MKNKEEQNTENTKRAKLSEAKLTEVTGGGNDVRFLSRASSDGLAVPALHDGLDKEQIIKEQEQRVLQQLEWELESKPLADEFQKKIKKMMDGKDLLL